MCVLLGRHSHAHTHTHTHTNMPSHARTQTPDTRKTTETLRQLSQRESLDAHCTHRTSNVIRTNLNFVNSCCARADTHRTFLAFLANPMSLDIRPDTLFSVSALPITVICLLLFFFRSSLLSLSSTVCISSVQTIAFELLTIRSYPNSSILFIEVMIGI